MFYALNWFLVLGLLALWSLAAWAFHAVTVWTIANAGVLADATGASAGLHTPEWLAPWLPAELTTAVNSVVSALKPAVESVLGWAPSLAGGLSVAVWVVWGMGSVLLIGLGAVLSGLIALARRQASGSLRGTGGPAAAG
jgi:hypothetical protein